MDTFIYDSFTAADGTFVHDRSGETNATWAETAAGFAARVEINGNAARFYPSDWTFDTADVTLSSSADLPTDFDLTASVNHPYPAPALLFHCANSLGGFGTRLAEISRVTGGTNLRLISGAGNQVWITAGSNYLLRVEVRGTSLKYFIDGTEVLASTALAAPAGPLRMIFKSPGAYPDNCRVNSFLIETPPPPPPPDPFWTLYAGTEEILI